MKATPGRAPPNRKVSQGVHAADDDNGSPMKFFTDFYRSMFVDNCKKAKNKNVDTLPLNKQMDQDLKEIG